MSQIHSNPPPRLVSRALDLWAVGQQDRGAESSTVRRRLSAQSSFYRYCAAHDLADRVSTAGVARPMVDPDYTATIGLDRDQAVLYRDPGDKRGYHPGSLITTRCGDC